MRFLIDTNVLLRGCDRKDLLSPVAKEATKTLKRQGGNLYILSQNLAEFYSVFTRPVDKNGMGYTIAQAQREMKRIKRLFPVLKDLPTFHDEWERLILDYQVKGIKVFDARLVAGMLVHNITHVLTFDRDFSPYKGITVVRPSDVNLKK